MPKKYPPLTSWEVIKILEAMGFLRVNVVGDHAQYIAVIKEVKRSYCPAQDPPTTRSAF